MRNILSSKTGQTFPQSEPASARQSMGPGGKKTMSESISGHAVDNCNGFRLSIVVPMYNEEDTVPILLDRVVPILERITSDYEIVCVNDGSFDRTFELLNAAHERNKHVKILNLSRNFGKELALTAGIAYASGAAVIPLDADLQDPPELIPDLIAKWREGNDVVIAVRRDRSSDTLSKRVTASLFYRLIGRVSEVQIPANAGDFRIMDRRVIEALKRMPERTRFMKGIFGWLGFKQAYVTYVRPVRASGCTKWRLWQLWNFGLEGIFSFTTLPLRIWTYLGVTIAIAALGYLFFILLRTLAFGVDVPGYASIVVTILFFSGMNMIGLGILGEYLGRVFIEVKQRPLYLVRDAIGFDHWSLDETVTSKTHQDFMAIQTSTTTNIRV
jgi:polyisoprenyl-phosphate glycosyltransferase